MTNSHTTEKIEEMIEEASRSESEAICDDNPIIEFASTGQKNALVKVALPVAKERDVLAEALAKINAIRNSIIGRQSVNWSEHICPLVAALNDAGYVGEEYTVARAKAEKELAAVRDTVRERDALAHKLSAAHDVLDLLQEDGSLGRVTWDEFTQRELTVSERITALAQQHAAQLREPHPNEVALAAELANVKAALVEWRDADRALVTTLSQHGAAPARSELRSSMATSVPTTSCSGTPRFSSTDGRRSSEAANDPAAIRVCCLNCCSKRGLAIGAKKVGSE